MPPCDTHTPRMITSRPISSAINYDSLLFGRTAWNSIAQNTQTIPEDLLTNEKKEDFQTEKVSMTPLSLRRNPTNSSSTCKETVMVPPVRKVDPTASQIKDRAMINLVPSLAIHDQDVGVYDPSPYRLRFTHVSTFPDAQQEAMVRLHSINLWDLPSKNREFANWPEQHGHTRMNTCKVGEIAAPKPPKPWVERKLEARRSPLPLTNTCTLGLARDRATSERTCFRTCLVLPSPEIPPSDGRERFQSRKRPGHNHGAPPFHSRIRTPHRAGAPQETSQGTEPESRYRKQII